MKKEKKSPEESLLRQKAEEKFEKLQFEKSMPLGVPAGQSSSESDMQKLIHELQVHQIELELQNEELQNAVEKAAIAIALYDFAPNGYFTIRPDHTIYQLNLNGAKMLGKERLYLKNSDFNQFITTDTKPVFTEFLQKCFETSSKQTCEIALAIQRKPRCFLYLEGIITEDNHHCLVVAVDITERKRAEESLRESEKMYRLLAGNLPETSVFLFDQDLRFILAEGFLHPEFGFTTSNMEGKSLWEVLPLDRANHLAPIYKNALEGKPTENLISEYKGHSYSANILPIKNTKGEIIAGMVVSQDITTRKKAEEALKSNYSLLRIAGETTKFGGWSLDIVHRKVTWSDEVAAIHEMPAGYSPALEEGINFYAPEWRDKITRVLNDCVKNGIPFDQEMELITAKGNRIWVRAAGEAVRAKSGTIFKIQGSFQDISDRKKSEELIRESEERFRNLLQNVSSVSVQGYSPDGTTQYWNKASERLYGYTEKDAIGRNLLDLIIPPEMQDGVKQAIQQMAETGKPIPSSELLLMRSDGSRVPVYSSHAIVQMQGKMPELFCIDIDITDRKRAEEALRVNEEIFSQFMKNSPIYIFFKDENIRSLRLSRNFERILGKPYDELIGKSMYELFPSDFAKSMVETDRQILKEGKELSYEEEFNGRFYSTTKFPIQIEGKPNFLAGFTIDITEQKLAEEALKESEARLRELNATKDKFFSIIAHDLKSPFNSIMGFSSLLERQIQERDYVGIEKYAGIIQYSSQQAMDLLMNLLEWSRSQTGRMVFNPENVDIAALINQTTDLLNASAQQKLITVNSEGPVKLYVSADKAMISTILRNLISNAIKYTNTGGEIVISTEQMPNELVVSVKDNGIGIKEESIGKLFRMDVSHSTLGTKNEKGTGLGLLLCKEFIDKLGGRIWVESEPGKGSKFFFSIPNVN